MFPPGSRALLVVVARTSGRLPVARHKVCVQHACALLPSEGHTGTGSPAVLQLLLEAKNRLWRHKTKIKITTVTTNLRHTSTDIPSLAIYRVCRFIPHYVPPLGYGQSTGDSVIFEKKL